MYIVIYNIHFIPSDLDRKKDLVSKHWHTGCFTFKCVQIPEKEESQTCNRILNSKHKICNYV